jgi:hypothetical protein
MITREQATQWWNGLNHGDTNFDPPGQYGVIGRYIYREIDRIEVATFLRRCADALDNQGEN